MMILLIIKIHYITRYFSFVQFPVFWRKNASIFLGDAGSTLIAFFVAWIAIIYHKKRLHSPFPQSLYFGAHCFHL